MIEKFKNIIVIIVLIVLYGFIFSLVLDDRRVIKLVDDINKTAWEECLEQGNDCFICDYNPDACFPPQ